MPQRFGTFEHPDFFEFKEGKAYCRDCGNSAEEEPLVGSFKLNAASSEHSIPGVEGDLINQCGNHHFEFGHNGKGEHNIFRIDVKGKTIGETNSVSSMATGLVVINLTDRELKKEFEIKQGELSAAFRRFWRI